MNEAVTLATSPDGTDAVFARALAASVSHSPPLFVSIDALADGQPPPDLYGDGTLGVLTADIAIAQPLRSLLIDVGHRPRSILADLSPEAKSTARLMGIAEGGGGLNGVTVLRIIVRTGLLFTYARRNGLLRGSFPRGKSIAPSIVRRHIFDTGMWDAITNRGPATVVRTDRDGFLVAVGLPEATARAERVLADLVPPRNRHHLLRRVSK